MRKQCQPKPQSGSVRTVRRFLWWPLRLNNEWRWLEWATICQVYHGRHVKVGIGDAYRVRWNNAQFEDAPGPLKPESTDTPPRLGWEISASIAEPLPALVSQETQTQPNEPVTDAQTEEAIRLIKKIRRIAQQGGCTMAQAAWALIQRSVPADLTHAVQPFPEAD